MLIVKIKGGLGNQLFQYALGRRISIENNSTLFLDLSFYENKNVYRVFELSKFCTSYKIADLNMIRKFRRFESVRVNQIFNYLRPKCKYISENTVSPFNPRVLTNKSGFFDGYWQSENYFKEAEAFIRSDLTLRIDQSHLNPLLEEIRSCSSVSIHIRRGDYLNGKNKSIFAPCGPEYYSRAVRYFAEHIGKDVRFFVFSDDYEWVKKNLDITYSHTYVGSTFLDYEDLFLMGQCRHNIIANSTFSWWGAWLNGNKNKIIVAPEKWFAEPFKYPNEIVPDHWLKM